MKRSFLLPKQMLRWQLAKVYLIPSTISSFKLIPPKKVKTLPTNTELDIKNLKVIHSSLFADKLLKLQRGTKNQSICTIEGTYNSGLITIYSQKKSNISPFKGLLKYIQDGPFDYKATIFISAENKENLIWVKDLNLLIAYDKFNNLELIDYIRKTYMMSVVLYNQ